jgi:DNA mismatch repair ATPase MutL
MNIIVTLMKQNKGDRLMFKRNLSLVIAAMLGAVLIACGSTDTAKTTKKADTENTEAVTELAEDTQSEETALTETQDNTETADGTAADSEKQQDSSSDTKSSEKDSTSAKQETAGKDKAASTSSSSGSKTSSGSSTSSGKSDTAKPASAAGSKGTDSSSGTANKPAAHTHTWVKYVANTIQHKEEGHYETKVVKAAYDEPQYDYHYVCLKCGKDLGTDDTTDLLDHEDVCDGNYTSKLVQVGSIHHDAVTEQVYVVDQAAYTENVYGERCSGCGATK